MGGGAGRVSFALRACTYLAAFERVIPVGDAVRLSDAVLLTYYTVEQVNDHPALG